jgi:hypothetical protein
MEIDYYKSEISANINIKIMNHKIAYFYLVIINSETIDQFCY